MNNEYPILLNYKEIRQFPNCPRSIPWEMIAPHERQAQINHGQTLERLAERGGLGIREALWVLKDYRWKWADIGPNRAEDVEELISLVNAFNIKK